jgi:YidC/Oxa1 family membrane protein insertase
MFQTIIVQPLLNILFVIDAALPGNDFGLSVIILTLLIRFALYPLAKKQLHSQKALTAIQPEVNKLKEKYKKDPQKLQAATMELYKEKEVNPFGSCLPLIIQMPFLIGLFYVFMKFRDEGFTALTTEGILGQIYPFVQNFSFVQAYIEANEVISTSLLGLINLAQPFLPLAIVAGILQFIQSKMLTPKKKGNDMAANMMSQMIYIFPVVTVVIAANLPAALPLYWSVTTIFAIIQQYFVMHHDVEELEEGSERKPVKKSQRNRK